MSELRDEFCRSVKERYPTISAKADAEYERMLGDYIDPEYYSWFEANALNREMSREVPASEYQELLTVISSHFVSGDEAVRKCIDVAFVENLFWHVSKAKAATYWEVLPKA